MLDDLKCQYRTVLISISEDLTEREEEELRFFCKDHIPKSFLSNSTSGVKIFDRLEDAGVISLENLNFLTKYALAIKRLDLITHLTLFELTRELVFYALKRQGTQPSMQSSTESVGLHLAELVDTIRDRVDVPAQGLIESLLKTQQNVVNVLEVVFQKALPNADKTKPNTLALLVAIAAEIVLPFGEGQKHHNLQKSALDVAIELANHLFFEVANFGWKNFCLYVEERHSVHFPKPVASDLPWQLALTDLVGEMEERFFSL